MNAIESPPNPPKRPAVAADEGMAIDTSKMSAGQRNALELTEAARESGALGKGLVQQLFLGRLAAESILPFPAQREEDRDQGDAFLGRLENLLRDEVDADEIDRTGEIPAAVIDALAGLGAFGIKIPADYGGLGLSQTNYCRAAMMLGSHCGNLTALISAHQSIGVPQPLLMFGTEEQKRRFLPRLAKGEISAFALTEPGVGSDPARMETRADPSPDGSHFILNGEKLWCTNGTRAGLVVVMARTPALQLKGRTRQQITAFIVEMDSPGIEITHRCRFMGLKALYNAVIRFKDVRVPRENILLAEGKGLRVALATLNTGRLTLPAACAGLSKRCLEIVREWAGSREQWGAPIGRHGAVADKIARMAANVFAMEAMTLYTASLVDRDKRADIRLEAAMAKLWGTERAWEIVNETMQIRGGRGYETAASLAARGEQPVAVERFLRDCRINTIFEGSSEIMRLFLAREALDPHLKRVAVVLNSKAPMKDRLTALARAACYYPVWYARQWMPAFNPRAMRNAACPALRPHARYVARASRKLARRLFHAMVRFGPALEKQQVLLGRFVDIGAELFAMIAVCARAEAVMAREGTSSEAVALADFFCRTARIKIRHLFTELGSNADRKGYRLARELLAGNLRWLEAGIVRKPGFRGGDGL